MRRSPKLRRSTTVAIGALALFASAMPVSAQRRPRVAVAASPPPAPPQMTTPYPGATVTVDPQLYQLWYQQRFGRYSQGNPLPQHRPHQREESEGYYVPVPYPVYAYPSYGGGVTDANGRPLYIETAPSRAEGGYGLGTPDLTGTPYVADANGAMVVDFGSGVRTIPSCAAQSAEQAPNGQPRTVFYQPAAGGVILRAGQRGRVVGVPPADAKACYTVDQYGRMAVDW